MATGSGNSRPVSARRKRVWLLLPTDSRSRASLAAKTGVTHKQTTGLTADLAIGLTAGLTKSNSGTLKAEHDGNKRKATEYR
jgi:hypothetical protein